MFLIAHGQTNKEHKLLAQKLQMHLISLIVSLWFFRNILKMNPYILHVRHM
ncbi:hypothetical protein ACJX0J_036297, partial [Zea mays]